MHSIEVVFLLLGIAVLLGLMANGLRLPYPILLVLGGLLLSLQAWMPRLELPPQIVFLAFLPPLLYAAAFNTPWQAFRQQCLPLPCSRWASPVHHGAGRDHHEVSDTRSFVGLCVYPGGNRLATLE